MAATASSKSRTSVHVRRRPPQGRVSPIALRKWPFPGTQAYTVPVGNMSTPTGVHLYSG